MIYIVIPVHNRIKLTISCLDCLKKQTYKDFNVIVVDDGSTDGTSEEIIKEFDNFVEILKGDGNLWWAGAANLGVNYALNSAKDTDFILTLNDDLIIEPDYLQELFDCYKKYPNSLIGSLELFINHPGRIIFGGGFWSKATAGQKKHFKIGEEFIPNKVPEVMITDLLNGRGTLISVNVFREIGLYDNINFPQYAADRDFALRAKNRGYNLLISTKAKVYSVVKETGKNFIFRRKPRFFSFLKSFFSIRSPNNLKVRLRFARKHAKFWLIYFLFDLGRVIFSFLRKLFNYYFRRNR